MDFRLCDCNYAKLIFLNKLKKLNSNFKLLVGLVSNTPLIIQARSFLWPLLARLFYYLSPTQGVCPYLTILAWTAYCTHFLFSLVSKCICYWERRPKLKDIEKMIICPIAKIKCFVWNYVIQDMLSTNKY